jgi:hypothetical protein
MKHLPLHIGCILIILTSTFACQPAGNHIPETSYELHRYTIDNEAIQPNADLSEFFTTQTIRVAPEVNLLLDDYLDEILYLNDLLIIVSRRTGFICAVDEGGELVWKLEAGSQPFDMFQRIGMLAYNEVTQYLEIHDDREQRLYRFDLQGEFVDRRPFIITGKDFLPQGDSCRLFDISGYPNLVNDTLASPQSLVRICDDGTVSGWKKSTSATAPMITPFIDYNEFNRFGQHVYYNSSLSDSFFLVEEAGLELSYLVDFAANNRSQQVVDDPTITDTYMHLYQNQIPYTWQTIIDDAGTFYGIYNNSRKNFFTIIDPDDRTLVNSAYLRCDDLVFTEFDEYWRGYFFDVLYDYEFDFYQQALPANDYVMDASLKKQLEQLTDQYGDQAGRVFVVARMK